MAATRMCRAARLDQRRPVAGQRHRRQRKSNNTFPRREIGVNNYRRTDMSLLIEDLARDRIRQIERDSERARQVRQARAVRRSAKQANR
jgi:hypothetical protein